MLRDARGHERYHMMPKLILVMVLAMDQRPRVRLVALPGCELGLVVVRYCL